MILKLIIGYNTVSKLGKGSYGRVYEWMEVSTGRRFAVKTLLKQKDKMLNVAVEKEIKIFQVF